MDFAIESSRTTQNWKKYNIIKLLLMTWKQFKRLWKREYVKKVICFKRMPCTNFETANKFQICKSGGNGLMVNIDIGCIFQQNMFYLNKFFYYRTPTIQTIRWNGLIISILSSQIFSYWIFRKKNCFKQIPLTNLPPAGSKFTIDFSTSSNVSKWLLKVLSK